MCTKLHIIIYTTAANALVTEHWRQVHIPKEDYYFTSTFRVLPSEERMMLIPRRNTDVLSPSVPNK